MIYVSIRVLMKKALKKRAGDKFVSLVFRKQGAGHGFAVLILRSRSSGQQSIGLV